MSWVGNKLTALKDLVGNLNFVGTGQRITGDFSNATVANRVMFQSSTVNGNTELGVIPNGTATLAKFKLNSAATPTNSSYNSLGVTATEAFFQSDRDGSGSYVPMTFYVGGSERMRIDTSGNVTVTNAGGGLGYGTGAGGTVTQATSKSTAVTLNKPTGQITMNNAALAAGTTVVFQVNNSLVSASDVVLITANHGTSGDKYNVWVWYTVSGAFWIALRNIHTASLSDAVVINFNVLKGAST